MAKCHHFFCFARGFEYRSVHPLQSVSNETGLAPFEGDYADTTVGFGLKLAMLAKSKGYTQKQIAQICGLSRITIHRYFNGRTDLRSSDLFRILKILAVDVEGRLISVLVKVWLGRRLKRASLQRCSNCIAKFKKQTRKKTLLEQISWWAKASPGTKLENSNERIQSYIKSLSG